MASYVGYDIEVTPQLAAKWLEDLAPNQQDLCDGRVLRYVYDMRRGLWRPNFNPILFNMEGQLENGQHRLTAVVESRRVVRMLVMQRLLEDPWEDPCD